MNQAGNSFGQPLAELYDIFVDWPGRLSRELPPLLDLLRQHKARRVLDVGCGTGRHVAALLNEQLDAHGSDASDAMLQRAASDTGIAPERLHQWRLGDPPPESIQSTERFDAIVALGNVWPQVIDSAAIDAATASLHDLLRPGGLVLLGLKALAVREREGNPYMPLLRRQRGSSWLHFIRFIDFALPQIYRDEHLCRFHMIVAESPVLGPADEQDSKPVEPLLDNTVRVHQSHLIRSWDPNELRQHFKQAGFAPVHVTARIGDSESPPPGEDVFLHAIRPPQP